MHMQKRIVVAGIGVAGAQVVKGIDKQLKGRSDYDLTVVDSLNFSTFAPLLHEAATGVVCVAHVTHPARNIVAKPHHHFKQARITGMDRHSKVLKTEAGDVPYDILILALGARSNDFNVPGVKQYAFPIKVMEDAVRLRRRMIDTAEQAAALPDGNRDALLHYVVVGGGYTGVELAGQLADWFRYDVRRLYPEIKPEDVSITLVHSGDRILPMLSPKNSAVGMKRLERLGVKVKVGTQVTAVTAEGATLSDGTTLASKNVIWASGVLAVGDLFVEPAKLVKGRIPVKATLQMADDANVFVVGDLAAVTEGNGPHPQTAQAAFEQAHLAARNVRHLFESQPLEGFYYKHKGDLVPIGHGWAVAEVGGVRFHGRLAWWLRRAVYLRGFLTWFDRVRVIGDWASRIIGPRDTSQV